MSVLSFVSEEAHAFRFFFVLKMAGKVRRKNWKKTKGRKNTNNKSQSKKERRENKTVFGRAKNAAEEW